MFWHNGFFVCPVNVFETCFYDVSSNFDATLFITLPQRRVTMANIDSEQKFLTFLLS